MKRRKFLKNLAAGSGVAATAALSSFYISKKKPKKGLGIALVGLGSYATWQLGPALNETSHCHLAGIVTGSPEKIPKWQREYDIPDGNVYSYDTYDEIAGNSDIDIIYIVLPNGMHAEYTIRGAEAGKHMICEKPMATSVEDADRMIQACEKAGKTLSIGYRLHYEPHNREMMRLGQQQVYGGIPEIRTGFAFGLGAGAGWRLDKKLSGGGPLMDIGIYTVQGAIYTKGMLPVRIREAESKVHRKNIFDEVEEEISWIFEYEDGTFSKHETSYATGYNYLKAFAKEGEFGLDPAFSYGGLSGYTPEGSMGIRNVNQQARQMDAQAQAAQRNEPSRAPGEMGRRDTYLLYKIYEAASTGGEIELDVQPEILDRVK